MRGPPGRDIQPLLCLGIHDLVIKDYFRSEPLSQPVRRQAVMGIVLVFSASV